jgi:hypothetical protein
VDQLSTADAACLLGVKAHSVAIFSAFARWHCGSPVVHSSEWFVGLVMGRNNDQGKFLASP